MKSWFSYPDEWYPVLRLTRYRDGTPDGVKVAEFSDEEIAELRALEARFNEWQRKIAERFGVLESRAQYDRQLVYDAEPSETVTPSHAANADD